MNDRYRIEERIAICMDSGMTEDEAIKVAAKELLKRLREINGGQELGWSLKKAIRMVMK
jgi:uncharacterized protein YoaH (UPF0181 family)